MEVKIDRRVIKTKERLYKVFIELLSTKPIKDITVKELSEKADINRATFYLHYRDVFDLMEQIQHEIADEFALVCDNLKQDFTDEGFKKAFKSLLDFINENKDLCIGLFLNSSDKKFFEKLVTILIDKCFNESLYTRYGFAFATAGCVGIIIEWIKNDMRDSTDLVVDNTLKLINKIKI